MKPALWGCGCVGVSGVVAAFGARLVELSRLPSVDGGVGAAARWVSGRVPDLGALPASERSTCLFYPVIERFTLTGVTDADTGRVLSPIEAYSATSSTVETATWLFVGLIVSALIWTMALGRQRPDGVLRMMARATVHSAPFVLAASAVYWPMVSFWGTLGFDLADSRGVSPPVVDSALSRIGIGAGLWLGCSVATVVFARSGLRRAMFRSAADEPARIGLIRGAQGASADGRLMTSLRPDAPSGSARSARARAGFGRLAAGGALAGTIVVLLCSPLAVGLIMGAVR